MALPKKVKLGGSFYEGYKLSVSSTPGEYPIAVLPSNTSFVANGFSVTPDSAGLNDHFKLEHVNTTATVGGSIVTVLATSIYNIGGGITIALDFATLENVKPGESLRFTYVNTSSVAMPVYIMIESIR